MTKDTIVTVFDQQQYGEWPPSNAVDALAWFAEKINSIPEEFRDSAQLDIDARRSYECDAYAYANISIYYLRPETDEEEAEREAEEAAEAERCRESDLRKLAELKAKYEA